MPTKKFKTNSQRRSILLVHHDKGLTETQDGSFYSFLRKERGTKWGMETIQKEKQTMCPQNHISRSFFDAPSVYYAHPPASKVPSHASSHSCELSITGKAQGSSWVSSRSRSPCFHFIIFATSYNNQTKEKTRFWQLPFHSSRGTICRSFLVQEQEKRGLQ